MSRAVEEDDLALRDHLALALEAGGLGTWRVDNATGTVTIDDQMARLFGIAKEDFGGTFDALISSVHPDDVARLQEVGVQLRIDKAPFETEYRVVWPDGSIHWLHGRGRVLVGPDGEAVGTIGCVGDVTARKELEEASVLRAAAAERAALEERLQRARSEFINVIDGAVLEARDHRQIMRRVASAAVPKLGDWCSIHFVPEPGAAPIVEVAHSDPAKLEWAEDLQRRYPYDPDAVTGVAAVVRSGRMEFLQDIDDSLVDDAIEASGSVVPREELRAIVAALDLTSVITVPMRTPTRVIGAMQFLSAESRRRYDHNDAALAQLTASRVAVALETAWMNDQHRMIASTLQAALLPPGIPTPPFTSVAARYWATGTAPEVGGDFYDVFAVAENKWAVVIGDVCGTGPQAAGVIAIARHTIRAAAKHGAGPVEVLEWVNDALHAGLRDLFCTALYATLEHLGDGRYRFEGVAGGHPLPIVVRADGTAATVGHWGTLLGVLPEISATVTTTDLGPGDTLVMHTDGVNDIAPPHNLSPEALVEIVRGAARGASDAASIATRLGLAIEKILPIPQRTDDIALVVVRFGD